MTQELKTITVGGAIVGIGIESSSFKHGFVVRHAAQRPPVAKRMFNVSAVECLCRF